MAPKSGFTSVSNDEQRSGIRAPVGGGAEGKPNAPIGSARIVAAPGPNAAAAAVADVGPRRPSAPRKDAWPSYAVLGVVAVLFLIPVQDPATAALNRGGALLILLVGLIATKVVADHVAALIFFVAAVGIAAIPPGVAFSGFSAGASWLIFAGSFIAAALTETGLSVRVARTILRFIGRSYASVIATLAIACFVLALLLPSTAARIMLLVPIVLALADGLGFAAGSKGRTGMMVATLTMSYLPCVSILTSGNRTLAMAGLAQTLYGIELGYSDFLLWNFPVLTVALAFVVAVPIVWRYREPPNLSNRTHAFAAADEPSQKFVLGVMLCALALWATDFLHHVSPAWIGLAAVVAFLVGPSRALGLFEKARFDYWIMFVAFISLGGVIAETGLGAWIGEFLVSAAALQPAATTGAKLWNLGAISLNSICVNLAATNLAGSVVLMTLVGPIAAASGFSIETTLVLVMPSFAVCPIAFQAPIFLVAARMAGLPLRELNICLMIVTAATLVLLIPLQLLWLSAIGVLA